MAYIFNLAKKRDTSTSEKLNLSKKQKTEREPQGLILKFQPVEL